MYTIFLFGMRSHEWTNYINLTLIFRDEGAERNQYLAPENKGRNASLLSQRPGVTHSRIFQAIFRKKIKRTIPKKR